MNSSGRADSIQGFTLIELMMVIAIIGILAAIGINSYRVYIIKAQTAQTLVDYGHIRTVIGVASQVDGRTNLQLDSVPGAAPPALKGELGPQEFNGRDAIKFQLVKAPAGTFASFPDDDTYALVATADNAAAVRRLRILRNLLPHPTGDKLWAQDSAEATSAQLTYPLDVGVGNEPPPGPAPPVTPPVPPTEPEPPPPKPPESNASCTATKVGSTWTASCKICVNGKDGKPLTGQTNTAIRYRVITPYANFQEDLKIDSATGCLVHEYSGLPLNGEFRIEAVGVVDYNPPNSGGPSSQWDGVLPNFSMTGPP